MTDGVWVVDYDIPVSPANRRLAFYRRRRKLMESMGMRAEESTASVLICPKEELAKALYELAKEYGEAHLYQAKEVRQGWRKREPRPRGRPSS